MPLVTLTYHFVDGDQTTVNSGDLIDVGLQTQNDINNLITGLSLYLERIQDDETRTLTRVVVKVE